MEIVKKLIIILVLLNFPIVANAEEFEVDIYRPTESLIEGIESANNELSILNSSDDYFDYFIRDSSNQVIDVVASGSLWSEYGIISFGSNSGKYKYVKELEGYEDLINYQYEYIGYTLFGDKVPNPYYPVDSYPSSEIMGRWVWVEEPELMISGRRALVSFESRRYLNALSPADQDEFVKQLINGLEDDYSDMFDEDLATAQGTEAWIRRAGVVIPPTRVSRGIVRLWHTGGAWYTNVIMNPLYFFQPDFRIEFDGVNYTDDRLVTMNASETIDVINTSDLGEGDVTESISWYVDGVFHSEDTNPYSNDTINNSRIQLPISDTTEIKLIVKVLGNTEVKEVIHDVTLAKQGLLGLPAGSITGDVVVASNEPGNHIFDVSKGIPTGEDVYTKVITDEYILDYDFIRQSGGRSYTATITGEYDNGDGTTTPFSESRSVRRSYSYYEVDWYYMYEIEEATVYNYALNSHKRIMPSSTYNISISHTAGRVTNRPSNESMDVGTVSPGYNFQSRANSMIGSYSTSDGVIVLNNVSSGPTSNSAKVNLTINHSSSEPVAAKTDQTLYAETTITETLANKRNTPTSATVVYRIQNEYNTGRRDDVEVNLSGNEVTVHTPVVCYPIINEEDLNNNGVGDRIERTQQSSIDISREQLILGESFSITYPLDGQHWTAPGYGNRNYSATTLNRQVQFTFDVYRGSNDSGRLLKAGQWHDFVEGGEDRITEEEGFYIPQWNHEMAKASILFRTIPVNSQDLVRDGYSYNLNDSISTYKAVEQIDVELSSKVHSFSITDVADPDWHSHFVKGDYFEAAQLPIMEGKNTEVGYEQKAIKLGYEVKYNLVTNGNMTGRDDVMVITPTYYHVDEGGNNRQAVDVYYESMNGFVRLGSSNDTMKNDMVLNFNGRAMRRGELSDTASVLDKQNRENGYGLSEYYEALSGNYAYNIKLGDQVMLTEMQKTYIGSMTSGTRPNYLSEEDVLESEQRWYGEFYLPSQTVIVPSGIDLSHFDHLAKNQSPFLQGGYIIVNFSIDLYHDIQTIGELELASPYLSYDNYNNGNKRGNQWFSETYDISQGGDYLMYGDILFYHVNKRASGNYE